jgi:hypothetical protein
MVLEQPKVPRALIVRIFERLIAKGRTYHPTIMREFNQEDRELIFGGPKWVEELEDEIVSLLAFVARESITSPKIIMKCCKMICPNHINGGIRCGDPLIEISTEIIKDELFIEVDDHWKTLSKEELIAIYKTNKESKTGK